jgi:sulfate adenylyltransferase
VSSVIAPHGGRLVDRVVADQEASALIERAARLPALVLDARERTDVELIAVGASSPIEGFLGRADYASVLERMRLANGIVWPLPLTLAIDRDAEQRLAGARADEAALVDETGRIWGVVRVEEIFDRDPLGEAEAIYRTTDQTHPGVDYLVNRPRRILGGRITALPLPATLPFALYRLTPRQLRAEVDRRGWSRVAGFQTRNPIHRAHEYLTKLALEMTDGLVIHPLVGETKSDDVPASVRFCAYEALVARYYPPERTMLAAFPAAMRYAGPREALFHALVRKNYGISHLIVGRDHAGVGQFYGPLDAQQIFDRFDRAELGVEPLRFDPTFYCTVCGTPASVRTCPHVAQDRLELSGSKVREILQSGGHLPREFTRPEVAEILREHYTGSKDTGPARPTSSPPARSTGFILWFTGLSGAGKSTLADAVRTELEPIMPVEILDGDEVRTHLSKGLGFSKPDRDTNIRRIGFVARLLARHGVAVISAAISPYADTRDEVRRLAAGEGTLFVEVFVDASIETLVKRDVKGLYKKAIAGEIANFTGVSDPYEPPSNPELVVTTDREAIDDSVETILATLTKLHLMPEAARSISVRRGSLVHAAKT